MQRWILAQPQVCLSAVWLLRPY